MLFLCDLLCRCVANHTRRRAFGAVNYFSCKTSNFCCCFFLLLFSFSFFVVVHIEITLTRCGAPNNLKIDPNCVANGAVYGNE